MPDLFGEPSVDTISGKSTRVWLRFGCSSRGSPQRGFSPLTSAPYRRAMPIGESGGPPPSGLRLPAGGPRVVHTPHTERNRAPAAASWGVPGERRHSDHHAARPTADARRREPQAGSPVPALRPSRMPPSSAGPGPAAGSFLWRSAATRRGTSRCPGSSSSAAGLAPIPGCHRSPPLVRVW